MYKTTILDGTQTEEKEKKSTKQNKTKKGGRVIVREKRKIVVEKRHNFEKEEWSLSTVELQREERRKTSHTYTREKK